jgi:3-oxoacyl-(acyl-carrier-protein) synthase
MEPKDQRKVDDFILYGIAAAQQAVEDSGWVPQTEEDRHRTGVMIGSGIGGSKASRPRPSSSRKRARAACRPSSSRARSST